MAGVGPQRHRGEGGNLSLLPLLFIILLLLVLLLLSPLVFSCLVLYSKCQNTLYFLNE